MIAGGFRRLREAGVLGMNRRNAEYIMEHNARSAYPIVDDKVLTKRLARRFGIPTPELYAVVENHGSIARLPGLLEGLREFVVKPARGAGGSGIILIRDRTERGFITQSGKVLTMDDFAYHLATILSGIHSLGGTEDRAVVEALIHPDPVFAGVTAGEGVPDQRIIVYRGVPVMAMVRLPTEASDGKANLHRGAIGAGIDIGAGVTLSAVHRSRIVVRHPDTGNPVAGIRVPRWEEMLLMAAKATEMTGLGYLGADFVLDREAGPVLLELNARPGLAIQIANRAGLRGRLEEIDRAPAAVFTTAASRVVWAGQRFGRGAEPPAGASPGDAPGAPASRGGDAPRGAAAGPAAGEMGGAEGTDGR
ncbi:MAG: alpha-L-glutamate ligase-like protein [Syntrophales bacterium]